MALEEATFLVERATAAMLTEEVLIKSSRWWLGASVDICTLSIRARKDRYLALGQEAPGGLWEVGGVRVEAVGACDTEATCAEQKRELGVQVKVQKHRGKMIRGPPPKESPDLQRREK